MMDLKKSFALLFVLLFSVSLFAVVVRSAPVPTLVVSQTANGVTAKGNSWTTNTAVALFFDVQDANHKVCQALTDYSGSFVATFPLDGTTVGLHNVIAVQGANQVTVTFTVGASSPPDDRLLNLINSINNSATQMLLFHTNETGLAGNNPPNKWVEIKTDKPAVFIVAVQLSGVQAGSRAKAFLYRGPNQGFIELADFEPGGGFTQHQEVTVAGIGILIYAEATTNQPFQTAILYNIMVEGTPGTVVTVNDPAPL